jgi:hypothetical protein
LSESTGCESEGKQDYWKGEVGCRCFRNAIAHVRVLNIVDVGAVVRPRAQVYHGCQYEACSSAF